jgi:hypothetical protein
MIVATLNVRGVGGSIKLVTLKIFLEKKKPDVLFMFFSFGKPWYEMQNLGKYLPNYYLIGIFAEWILLVYRGAFSLFGIPARLILMLSRHLLGLFWRVSLKTLI